MKKLKIYLQEHKRLKKCLKLLGVIGICLSVIFNAVIIGTAIAQAVSGNNDNNIENKATTPIKKVFEKQDYHYYSLNDITTKRFQSGLQDWLYYDVGSSNIWNISIQYNQQSVSSGQSLTNAQLTRLGIGFISNINDIYNENPLENLEYPTSADIAISYVQGNTYYSKEIAFYFADNSYYVIRYRQYFANINLVNGEFFNGSFAIGSTYAVNRNSTFALVLYEGSLYNILTTITDYTLGYEVGFGDGVNNGYAEGYADGQQNEMDDAFSILRKAFKSVADILSINVLPNLSLGVLVFTPVIVVVIIVVVKMIKG